MQDEKKKSDQPDKNRVDVPDEEECEPNTGNPKKDKTKPDCPDGYPDEQPDGKAQQT